MHDAECAYARALSYIHTKPCFKNLVEGHRLTPSAAQSELGGRHEGTTRQAREKGRDNAQRGDGKAAGSEGGNEGVGEGGGGGVGGGEGPGTSSADTLVLEQDVHLPFF